jgi:hypothetical protein
MSQEIAQQMVTAVAVVAVLLGLLLVVALRIATRLARIERRLALAIERDQSTTRQEESLGERKAAVRAHKDMFRHFLEEDPERRKLPKKEQFAGYRKWRQEHGLNWPGEGGGP